uniref:G_PROTEIN_RECEP_F1_2 domain-containing protein n=1 Tax=Elaeophora elaphi TaxID=1147741 RepID=A0A0R3RM31_9BILA
MIIKFSIYIAGGVVVFALNMLFFIAIARTKTNRERYGLTGMEFFADGLMGFAITLAGATRNAQIFLEYQNDTISRLACVFMPHNIILAWTEPMTALSMLVVSVDRIISIVKPVLYYKKMLTIQYCLIAVSNLSIFLLIFASALCSYLNNLQVHFFCWSILKHTYRTPNSRCPIFNRLYYGMRISAAAGSVVLYVITLFIVRRYNRRIKDQQNFGSVKINKRQLNFTKTVGLSCFATAGLYVIPMIVAFSETSNLMLHDSVYSTIVIISFLNSFSKTMIVGCRSHEIREAIINLMPDLFQK